MGKIIDFKTAGEFVNLNNLLINQNIEFRRSWEEDCKSVALSFQGNKFPVKLMNRSNNQIAANITKSTERKAMLNLVKRQWRVISNYLLNNEPHYVITEKSDDTTEEQLIEVRELLDQIFDEGEDESEGFYDTVMDDTIFYGIHRGIAWTLIYFDPDTKKYCFQSYDSMDTYVDLGVDKLSQIRKWLATYSKSKDELETKYPTDGFGDAIDWTNVGTPNEQTASDIKKSMLVEKPNTDTLLIREGYYIDDDSLVRIRTTATKFLEKTVIAKMKFIPVTYYAPQYNPTLLYPAGWFVDMIELDREINLLIQKMSVIIKTGGRFVYVKAGTVLTKSTNNLLNSLGVEVIEVTGSQEVPKQANFLQISQSDIEYLQFLMQQAEEEGGMKSDIMGTSSTGSNASGRAIQALQAGSKNNIGQALNELNKYMNRLTRMLLRMFKVFPTAQYYSAESKSTLETKEGYDDKVKVKVSVTGSDAFDEVTKKYDAIEILDYIQKFNPEVVIPPEVITRIMGVTNNIAEQIQEELDKQEDPDMQIAEGQAKKMLQGIPQGADEEDNHQVFIAIFSEALKNVPPDSPAAQVLMDAIRQHEAFLQAGPQQPPTPGQPQ